MKINLLPLGTVVLLKGGQKRIMITGFGPIDSQGEVYDYTGCLYPEGVISSTETLLFNHDQLESLYFNGYFDNEALEFMKKAQPLIEQAKAERKKAVAEVKENVPEVSKVETNTNIENRPATQNIAPAPNAPSTPVTPTINTNEIPDIEPHEIASNMTMATQNEGVPAAN